ncbi:MAG: FkbM family methyltransferase [Acidobacteriota bacterium]
MKLRDLGRVIGLGSSPREYPLEIVNCRLAADGDVQFARWLHPGETPKVVTQDSVDALRSFLHEGDVAIDIGAHTGDSTLPIALAVGPGGMVFALEPNPYVFKVLAANAGLNPTRTRIVPLMFAAMPADGEFEFEYSDAGYCNGGFHQGISRWRHGHFSKLRVAGRNLVAYLSRHAPDTLARVRYVKIDTEGFDRAVVQSIAPLIREARPYLKTEIYKHLPHDQRAAYFDELRGFGYRLFKWEDDRTYRGQELGRDDLSRWKHFDVFAVPAERDAGPGS